MKQPSKQKTGSVTRLELALLGVLGIGWSVMVLAASSRIYFVMKYGVVETVDPFLEPFAASNLALLFSMSVVGVWAGLFWSNANAGVGPHRSAVVSLAASLLPLVIWGMRGMGLVSWSAQFWEVLWIAAWTGLSFGALARSRGTLRNENAAQWESASTWAPWFMMIAMSASCGGWWFVQSVAFHTNFMLGFNDFGHFLQRVANTAEGRGVLLESPVLPMFWDHFNPGLLAIVPLWKIYPHVTLVFVLQAIGLAGSGLLVYAISRRFEHAKWTAVMFGLAWLAQPAVGQMNLAYTYGWHPITLAIPLLLAAIWCLLARRRMAATACTMLAMSLEEGVFVIVALVAANCAALRLVERWRVGNGQGENQYSSENRGDFAGSLSTATWVAVAVLAAAGFLLVYQLSGLAEFQTGRFVALGNSPLEILLSPLLRPSVFWGRVLSWENLVFVALLGLPCGLPSMVRGWRCVLPALLPLGVLIVWDHQPAHSLAFQYPSTLLPLFWLASISGAATRGQNQRSESALSNAAVALSTGLVLSLFVGQLPFSSPSLRDVEATTYRSETEMHRRSDAADGQWLLERVAEIRATSSTCLATGRIAAHLVGSRDVETVGQYAERRAKLAELVDRQGDPIRHYEWIVLDRLESFQQSPAQIEAVETEALASGFEVIADQYHVAILKRR